MYLDRKRVFAAAAAFSLLSAVTILSGQTAATIAPRTSPGDPLPGLSRDQLNLFNDGKTDFLEVETVADGLGPAFNGTSCGVCHSIPAIGGTGIVTEVRAADTNGATYLIHLFSNPNHTCQPRIPSNATVIAKRMPTPIFGAGLVEAIPDDLIRAREDPNDRDGDGITGRAAVVLDPATKKMKVGRFGWKAQQATLLAFAGDAYLNEMGITNDLFPNEAAAGISPQQLAACDTVRDPEDVADSTHLRAIDKFTNFMTFLAPISPGQGGQQVNQGGQVFTNIGCANCHVPTLMTGPSATNALVDRKQVNAFSDFLLHDIGTGDGIPQAAARAGEFRTAPLWGLRFRLPLMHDGMSENITDAISRHAGEAQRVKQQYNRLSDSDKQALLAFLQSL
jgi:CxxC motif-containing protein (DUF1111 family)